MERRHGLTINRQPYFSTPWIYWVTCTCRRYLSDKFASDWDAWKAGVDHLKSKI